MKYIVLLFFLIICLVIFANYNTNSISYTSPVFFNNNMIMLSIHKDFISYNTEILYSYKKNSFTFSSGISYSLYNSIEITNISDTLSNISYNNLPYIENTINLYSFLVPIIFNIEKNNYIFAFTQNIKYTNLYSTYSLNTSTNIGIKSTYNNNSFYLNIYDLVGQIVFSNNNLYIDTNPLIEFIYMRTINEDNYVINYGIKIESSYITKKSFNIIYNKYGINRSFIIDMSLTNIKCGMEVFSYYMKTYLSYFIKDKYITSVGYTYINGENTVKILLGVRL